MSNSDLHENLVQDAIAVLLLLQALEPDLSTATPEARHRLSLAISLSRRTLNRIRSDQGR